ncbi:MAG: hypothetical protein K9J06_12410 [Flavobacteriales bacterium]|nr:hypothetical protein [Flavobacteriales bacterium]
MTYFFIHTPKTSGTTFVDVLSRDRLNNIGYFYPSSGEVYDFEHTVKFAAPQRHLANNPDWQKFNFIAGHYTFGMHEVLGAKEFRYIGTMREPIGHYLSTYKALMRMSEPYRRYLLGEGSEDSIYALLDLELTHNLQTFFLSGLSQQEIREDKEGALRITIQNFDRYFDGFCLTEHFDESMHLLKRKGIMKPTSYLRKNVATNRMDERLDESLLTRVRQANDVDLKLYGHVVARFESEYSSMPNIRAEVCLFKLRNLLHGIFTKS